ncbi:MAG: hypothetical protein GY904_10990 [Planctomycetaceae bacterium]|nr:hypothetical protein [Planctomycetaceae bacterium]
MKRQHDGGKQSKSKRQVEEIERQENEANSEQLEDSLWTPPLPGPSAAIASAPQIAKHHDPRMILGLAGSLILLAGVFCPILSLPMVGGISYFANGKGNGKIIILISMVSLLLCYRKLFRYLSIPGLGALGMLGLLVVRFNHLKSEMVQDMRSEMAGNPFGGIGALMAESVQLQWGLGVMFVGAVMIALAASYERIAKVQT